MQDADPGAGSGGDRPRRRLQRFVLRPAEGLAARVRLARAGEEAFATLDRDHREAALDALLVELGAAEEEVRDLRRAVVGILTELDPADPTAREYRKRLATALY